MSPPSSWLSSALPRFSRPTSAEQSRLPRWRTSSPMAASAIPPPIVRSIGASRSASSSSKAAVPAPDKLAWLHRKQQQLEADLQILLDAQAEGLVAGLEGTSIEDEALSTGSSTPTAQSLNLHGRDHGRAHAPVKPSLAVARKGLYTTMRKMAMLKASESQYLDPELEECIATVAQMKTWATKRSGLQDGTSKIQAGEEGQKVARLRQEADHMQEEINEVEARLEDLRRTQRRLRREADEAENKVQAKLSSYKSSLNSLEADVRRFLADAASELDSSSSRLAQQGCEQDPHAARTLESAQQTWTSRRDDLMTKQENAEAEREALEEGAVVWRDVVKDVSDFERQLREDMARLPREPTTFRPGKRQEPAEADQRHGTSTSMADLVARMDDTTLQLESRFKLAEARDWKLLICAIGAELDAFKKGREILEAALAAEERGSEQSPSGAAMDIGLSRDMITRATRDESASTSSQIFTGAGDTGPQSDPSEEISDLDFAFGGARRANAVSDTDTEDDGPDPELLISHQDTDTE